jgi:replicative DNA helicase
MTPTDIITPEQLSQLEALRDAMSTGLRSKRVTAQDVDDYRAAAATILRNTPPPAPLTMQDIAGRYWDEVRQWANAARTGIDALDRTLGGGFLGGRLYALLGAPGAGKTALAIQWAECIASTGRPVVYVTSEDSPLQLYCRTLARLYSIEYGPLLRGSVKTDVMDDIMVKCARRPSADRLVIVDHSGAFSLEGLEAIVRAHSAKHAGDDDAPLVVIDYLQRLARSASSAQQDLRQAVTALTESLRDLGKRTGAAMLVLASQNRESYKNGGASNALASGKESGDIEYTADVLAALMEDKDGVTGEPGQAAMVLKIEKNRQGMTGAVKLVYSKKYQRFDEAPR